MKAGWNIFFALTENKLLNDTNSQECSYYEYLAVNSLQEHPVFSALV